MSWEIKQGDALERLREMPDESVHCCVTSPPYWGLRDYGTARWEGGDVDHKHDMVSARNGRGGSGSPGKQTEGAFPSELPADSCSCGARKIDGQLGLEKTPELYVSRMTEVFREVRRTLRSDGTLWLNIGDSYSGSGKGPSNSLSRPHQCMSNVEAAPKGWLSIPRGMKAKDLCGIPWMVAFALRSDGWYLRQDIIWSKPNPMPESVTDRCTKAHEYLFLLSKSGRYFYDAAAILEDCSENTHARLSQDVEAQIGSARANGGTRAARPMKALAPASWRGSEFNTGKTGEHQLGRSSKNRKLAEPGSGIKNNSSFNEACCLRVEKRNRRSVWEVTTQPFSEAHFATFPPKLIEPCILAGCPEGGTVLDPFAGAGTTGLVATRLQRNFIGIELNPAYVEMAEKRITQDAPLFNSAESYGVADPEAR